jgi:hypothetical protein
MYRAIINMTSKRVKSKEDQGKRGKVLSPSAIDSESIEPLSVLHSKSKFEW